MAEKLPGSAQVPMPTEENGESVAQITALVGSVMNGLKPMAEHQAQVQLAQIEAAREREANAFRFSRTTLVVLSLLAGATAFLFGKGSDQAGLQVIWFAMGALSGFGFGRVGRPRQ